MKRINELKLCDVCENITKLVLPLMEISNLTQLEYLKKIIVEYGKIPDIIKGDKKVVE